MINDGRRREEDCGIVNGVAVTTRERKQRRLVNVDITAGPISV